MIEPGNEFLRLGEVYEWLEGREFTRAQTRTLIEEGVIVGKPLTEWFRLKPAGVPAKEASPKAAQKNGRSHGRPRQQGDKEKRYRKSQIKEALKI